MENLPPAISPALPVKAVTWSRRPESFTCWLDREAEATLDLGFARRATPRSSRQWHPSNEK
jgi:hypothetical protein